MQKDKPPRTLDSNTFYGFQMDKDQQHFVNLCWDETYRIVFCNARAGTGKTQLATGVANLLYQYRDYDGIIYIVSPYGEDKQGFLPGDITKKSEIYYEPFYQALIKCGISPLVVIDNESQVSEKKKNSNYYIKCFTHTYLRGTNLDNKVVIVDEAQNFQTGDLKKTLTRLSDSCKTIVIGHEGQIDLTKKNTSGFMKFLNHFEGQPYSRSCTLTKNYRGIVSTWADELREV